MEEKANKEGKLTSKERKEIRRKMKISYYSVWMSYKGKKLRILIGVKRIALDENAFKVSFSYQSPKEEKDNLAMAKLTIKRNLKSNFSYFNITKDKVKPDSLLVLALAYPLLLRNVNWVSKAHVLYMEKTEG